ncbi:MAG: hypothetical protein ACRDFB_03505, partial [Rhabdochlamydiaceae bacterium]
PLFLLFFIGWFTPALHLPRWSAIFIVISAASQYATALIPELEGWRNKVHRLLSWIAASSLIPYLLVLTYSRSIDIADRLAILMAFIVMMAIVCTIVINKAEHRYLLWLQSGYFGVFFLATIFVTYF